MKRYIYTHNSKISRNDGWSYQAIKLYEITKTGLNFVGQFGYTFMDEIQAITDYLSNNVNQFKKFPKSFTLPKNAEMSPDRKTLSFPLSGANFNYPHYLLYESRYNKDNKPALTINKITLPVFGRNGSLL